MHPPHRSRELAEDTGPGRAASIRDRLGTLLALVVGGLVLALVAAALTGGIPGYEFRQDHRVTILSPGNGAKLPKGGELVVRWAVDGFTPLPAGTEIAKDAEVDDATGFFGVFVNTYIPTPGEGVVEWARKRNPNQCPADFCSTSDALGALGAVYTTATSVSIPYGLNIDPDRTQATGVTIVLLNARGERIGDSFWFLPTDDDSVRTGS